MTAPLMVAPYLVETFGASGAFARAFPGYEARREQVTLANAINVAIRSGDHLLAEAPTGVGKSFGYLVPLTWHLTEGAEAIVAGRPSDGCDEDDDEDAPMPRAVVVTANILLQNQLVYEDIPRLQKLLPWTFKAALAKGRGNYLCLDRLDEAERNPPIDRAWTEVRLWSRGTSTGDFAELRSELAPELRTRLTISSDDCTGRACPHYGKCYSERARRDLGDAHVIVTNYHMFFAHLAMKAETGAGLLPAFDIVVFDEAHAAPDVARDFFGFDTRASAVLRALRLLLGAKATARKVELEPIDAGLHARATQSTRDFFAALCGSQGTAPRLREPWPVSRAIAEGLCSALASTANKYTRAAEVIDDKARKAELVRAARRCLIYRTHVLGAMLQEDSNDVFFLEPDPRDHVKLRRKLINVGAILKRELYDDPRVRTVIATSATLQTSNGFSFVRSEMGAADAAAIAVDSPFDFERQALLVLPDMPDPSSPLFRAACATAVARVVTLAGGRTLGLFTSYAAMRAAAERLEGGPFTVLVQGTEQRSRLIERFRSDVKSVLLGTKSFWAGVDVPGEALSCVVIDRIPFESPDDPILDALQAQSPSSFRDYSLPRAGIELRQGVGRLIRSTRDMGAVVILDNRLRQKHYGRGLLAALPRMRMSTDLEDIRPWLLACNMRHEVTAGAA